MNARHFAYRFGLGALSASGVGRLLQPVTQGLGAILMFHHVRPWHPKAFDPHRGLEIEPAFLDATLNELKARGWDIVPMDAVPGRLRAPTGRPFAALTFDDGYRDNVEHALPILQRHGAPFTIYVTSGFADGEAALWWLDLAESVAREEKPSQAFAALYRTWRERPDLVARIAARADAAASRERTRALCLDWEALAALAAEPLCTIGAHTLTHPILGSLDPAAAEAEIAGSKAAIEQRLGRPVRHFAYPVGDRAAAGAREFALARAAGFETAVTTRPGMLFAGHAAHLHALPRLSVNGWHQSLPALRALLSGAPFALLNRGRRLDVA
jgi:peptidoglycan/xylan/chitin deacetylase (PgdA/CDA1 family)